MVDRLTRSTPPQAPARRPAAPPPAPDMSRLARFEDAYALPTFEPGKAVKAEKSARPAVDGRAAANARKEAETAWAHWRGGWMPPEDWRRVESNLREVNQTRFDDKTEIARQLKANAGLERQGLEALSPADADRYQRLNETLKDEPAARLALQLLLVEGTLERDRLLASLAALEGRELAAGLDKGQLLAELVQELAAPEAIAQRGVGTCTVTTLQILAARELPGTYVRLVMGLATEKGEARLANGEWLKRHPGTESADPWARSLPSRLWQPAFMEYANGEKLTYDNATGQHSDSTAEKPRSGLFAHEVDKAIEGFLGREVETVTVYHRGEEERKALIRRMGVQLETGVPVPVALAWGEADGGGQFHESHQILVTRFQDGRAHYLNPWGQRESMRLEELERRIQFATLGGVREETPEWDLLKDAFDALPDDEKMELVRFGGDRYTGRDYVIG
ncbi:MAG: hypothetical protein ACLGIN_13195 [Candidatus Sericytochromatia bacterium]